MKTAQELEILSKTCSQVLDSTVKVSQEKDGSLIFIYPASKHGHQVRAIPWDQSHDGQDLWQYRLDDLAMFPIGTLEPLMICGLLHF